MSATSITTSLRSVLTKACEIVFLLLLFSASAIAAEPEKCGKRPASEPYRWAWCVAENGAAEPAAAELEREIEAKPGKKALRVAAAALYDALGEYEKVSFYLEKALGANCPEYDLLAFSHHARGDHEAGAKYYAQASKRRKKRVREDPLDSAATSANEGWYWLDKGDRAAAKDRFQRAITKLPPKHPRVAVIEKWLSELGGASQR